MRNHILAFSSDRNMLRTLEFLLEAEQFTVTTAAGWAEARELLNAAENSIHLMILDTNGSGGNGLEPLSDPAIRDRHFPVIVLTGSPRRNTPERNGIAWMEKPVDRATLLRTIAALLCKNPDESNR